MQLKHNIGTGCIGFVLSCCVLLTLITRPALADEPIKIGVLANRGEQLTLAQWSATATFLSNAIEGYRFEIVPLGFDAIFQAVRDASIDFILTDTTQYVELQYLYGVSRIATLKNSGNKGEELTRFGSVIFTRKNSPFNTLEDLEQTTFGAVDPNSFGGWIMAEKEFLNHGMSKDSFAHLEFFGSHDRVVKAVEAGEIDAGTVRSDTLERMADANLISLDSFRILAAKNHAGFPFKVSTDLYPEWPFAKLSNTSDSLASKVLVALLNMPRDSQAARSARIAGWTTPLDYAKVHHLLQELQLGPFAPQAQKVLVSAKEVSFSELFSPAEVLFFSVLLLLFIYLIFGHFKYHGLLNIKLSLFNILLIMFEFGIISFLIYEVVVLDRLEYNLAKGYEDQNAMIKVADSLRQSSDDLSHFARTYVVTGNEEFKKRYYTTLDIRTGNAPRPQNYDRVYWDLSKVERTLRHPDGEPRSLKSIFESLPYSVAELTQLRRAEINSNALAKLEEYAFTAVDFGRQKYAIELLHSPNYYEAKERVMLPIDKMLELLYARTMTENAELHRQINRQIKLLLLVGVLFLGGNLVIYILLCKKVNKPVSYLTRVIKGFEAGVKQVREQYFYNDEIGYMIRQFFSLHKTLEESKQEVEKLLQRTQESIDYAAFIQGALVPRPAAMSKYFDDLFTIWEPRDVVGGDLFLFEELRDENEMLLMVIDCTGHGVPGALVTVLVKTIERQIVATIRRTAEIVSPANLLSVFNGSIKNLLQQDHTDAIANVGFDGTILYYNREEKLLRFASARTTLFLCRDGQVEAYKGDRHSIGCKSSSDDYVFTDHEVTVERPLSVYLATDGYLDQNGGEKGFPFGAKQFVSLIEEHHAKGMADQEQIFLQALAAYQGNEERNDDITLVAFKVHPCQDSEKIRHSHTAEGAIIDTDKKGNSHAI